MPNKNNYTFHNLKKYIKSRYSYISDIAVILSVILVYIFINNNYEFYVFSRCTISLGIIIGFIYTNMIKNKIIHKGMNNLNRLYFLSIMIAVVMGLVIIIIKEENNISYIFLFLSFQAVLEYCEIENIFNIENKYISNIIICLCYLFLYMFIIFINEKDYSAVSLNNPKFLNSYTIMSILISLCMSLSTLNKILIYRKNFSMDELEKIIYYMCSIILNLSGYFFIKINMTIVAVILLTIKCIAFIKFYNYVIDKIRDEYFNIINCNIEEVVNRKKQLNSVLLRRNKILNDTNTMINKAQNNYNVLLDSIYGAVCLFVDNKLQYINNSMINKFSMENNKFINMDIDIFLKKYCNISLDKIEEGRSYPFEICIDRKSEGYRVFLISQNKYNKLLYIEDLNDQNENKKLKKEFDEFLEYDKHKKEFFANISHELKTPINLISSALQLNNIYIQQNKIDAVDKNRKVIMQNCLRLIRTINNFIDANKISEGYITPDMKVYNIVDIVENTALGCNKYIRMFDNRLIFDSEDEEIFVICDKDLITRIILNLLSNSVKYGKKGGIIKVDLCIEGDRVCIKIKNDGPKIEKDIIPYIFDKFSKLNKSFNRIKEGSGLGLFLTKALVELQGGTIGFISDNKRNEFIIKFDYIKDVDEEDVCYENFEMNSIEEKVNIEFSDIYRA